MLFHRLLWPLRNVSQTFSLLVNIFLLHTQDPPSRAAAGVLKREPYFDSTWSWRSEHSKRNKNPATEAKLRQKSSKRPGADDVARQLRPQVRSSLLGRLNVRCADRWAVHSGRKTQKLVSRSQEAEKRLERQLIHPGRQGLGHRRSDEAPGATLYSCCHSSPREWGLPVLLWPKFPVLQGLAGQLLWHWHILPHLTERPAGMFTPDNPKGLPHIYGAALVAPSTTETFILLSTCYVLSTGDWTVSNRGW